MERFPFDQLLTFLVFLIIALSQIWAKLREQKKQKEKLLPRKIAPSSSTKTLEKKLPEPFQDLLEALGIPPHQLTPPSIKKTPPPSPRVEPKKILTPTSRVVKTKPVLSPVVQPISITKIKEEKIVRHPVLEASPSSAFHQKIIHTLSDRKQIQQAILLNEILGSPKALSPDFP